MIGRHWHIHAHLANPLHAQLPAHPHEEEESIQRSFDPAPNPSPETCFLQQVAPLHLPNQHHLRLGGAFLPKPPQPPGLSRRAADCCSLSGRQTLLPSACLPRVCDAEADHRLECVWTQPADPHTTTGGEFSSVGESPRHSTVHVRKLCGKMWFDHYQIHFYVWLAGFS